VKEIVFIADAFSEQFAGGAELSDEALIVGLKQKKYKIEKIRSQDTTPKTIEQNASKIFIVGNFVGLSEESKRSLHNKKYIIFEHDHKYLKTRNPIFFKEFIAPEEELTNIEFYKNANTTLCLTQLALDVFQKNTHLTNVDKIGASLWTKESLDFLESIVDTKKIKGHAVVSSNNPIKRTADAVRYCEKNKLEYELIGSTNYKTFLKQLSQFEKLVFLTGHLETCCRLVVEAKMLHCDVISQPKLIGAASEEWYQHKGTSLIKKVRQVNKNGINTFIKYIEKT
jgi:hypothetical protein